jgi:autotransporter-associated beta strand protein
MNAKNLIRWGLLLALVPLSAFAQTTYFTDNFSNGSTTNLSSIPTGTPTASATSYDIASQKTTIGYTTIGANRLRLTLSGATTGGWLETQAIFTTNAVALTAAGDYLDISIVFTNTTKTILAGGTSSLIWLGLFNSGGSLPLAGGVLANNGLGGASYATGNCANWQGYVSSISSNGTSSKIYTRPIQTGGGTYAGANQDLVCGSGNTGGYSSPGPSVLSSGTAASIALVTNAVYTLNFRISVDSSVGGVNTYAISNYLYSGSGVAGSVVYSQGVANVTNVLTASFDGFSMGLFNKGTSYNPLMDVSLVTIVGQSTPVASAPTITQQPVPVNVASNGSCRMTVAAVGSSVTYQWHRYGTNLTNGGSVSGATSDTLVISPAGAGDAALGANGYYVTVSGTGGYSVNSTTNDLSVLPVQDLTWNGATVGDAWNVAASPVWITNSVPGAVFNYGDKVTFDDTASLKVVTLSGSYLTASSVTVNSSGSPYTFQGSGSFAGPGTLTYIGAGQLTLNNANTYTGGTLISNAAAYVYLQNIGGLGTGPVTLAKAGGTIEAAVVGGNTTGLPSLNILDDFTIQCDVGGTYSGVIQGGLSGSSGKTLTFNFTAGNTNRIRVYGVNTVCDANLVLNGNSTSQAMNLGTVLAPYGASGSQIYNGVISGNGGVVQRASGTTILAGANTYAGGTYTTTGSLGFGIDSSPTTGTVNSGPIGTGSLYISPEVGSSSGSGQVFASGGPRTLANPIQYLSATNNHTLVIGGTNNLTFTGPYTLCGQDLAGVVTNRTLQVTNTGLTTFSGVIDDGISLSSSSQGFGLTKTGNGVLALSNTETYTGPTTVSAGRLQVNGSLAAASAVTVSSNATLSGTGTINGSVSVSSGGVLAVGSGSIGTLTINNALTLSGNMSVQVNHTGSASDKVLVSGTLTNAGTGTITVTNLGSALQTGDTFTLFSKPLANGSAMTVSGGGVTWTNNLSVNGTITVLPTMATNPTNITFSVSGSVLTLSWPADHLGWYLQVQTNSLSTGLGTNWVFVPGSSSVVTTNFTVNPANASVFYRLKSSNP